MSLYYALQNVSAAQAAPVGGVLPAGSQAIQTYGANNPNSPAPQFTWTVKATGIGAVSATAQLIGSQDGTVWETIGATAQASGNDITPGSKSSTVNDSFNFYSAYITAISGTSARAAVLISA